jgi:hypothetical protein
MQFALKLRISRPPCSLAADQSAGSHLFITLGKSWDPCVTPLGPGMQGQEIPLIEKLHGMLNK